MEWAERWPRERNGHILTPRTVNVTLFGERVFAGVIKLKVSRRGLICLAALNPMTSVGVGGGSYTALLQGQGSQIPASVGARVTPHRRQT